VSLNSPGINVGYYYKLIGFAPSGIGVPEQPAVWKYYGEKQEFSSKALKLKKTHFKTESSGCFGASSQSGFNYKRQ